MSEYIDPPGGGSLVHPSGKVRVTFDYDPRDPDPSDETGMGEEEYLDLNDRLAALGADNIVIKRART